MDCHVLESHVKERELLTRLTLGPNHKLSSKTKIQFLLTKRTGFSCKSGEKRIYQNGTDFKIVLCFGANLN